MSAAPDEPRQVGPYRLLGRLGAGGMGQVFLGVDAAGRQAAVKIVHPGLADDPRFRARFAREVAAGRLVHGRWTAELLDADADATPPWLATEYVAAPSLDQVVRDFGPVPPEAMARLALGLARALVAIHDAGLLHRDVKPSNVLLAADGPRLIDFGIAQAVDGTRLTATGALVGTPAFMSPEQAAGEELGPPSDVFSLGGVLVFAANGTGPHGTGTPLVLLRRVLRDDPDLGSLDGPLREVAGACLRRDPAVRPTPAELVERLEPVAQRRPGWFPGSVTTVAPAVATLPATSSAPAAPARRRLSRRLLLGGAVLGVGVAAAGLLAGSRTPTPAVRWSFPAGRSVSGLAAAGGAVFAVTDDGTVTALDTATGRSRWSVLTEGYPGLWAAGSVVVAGRTLLDARNGTARAAFSEDVYAVRSDLVVGRGRDRESGQEGTVAVDPVTGELRWGSPIGAGYVPRAALLSDDVALASCEGVDRAFDLVTGAELWTRPDGDAFHLAAAASGAAFYRLTGPRGARTDVEAVDARSGNRRWSVERDGTGLRIGVVAGQPYVFSGASLHAHDDATGAVRWTWNGPDRRLLHWLAGAGDELVVAGPSEGSTAEDTVVASLDPARGSTRWQTTLPDRPVPGERAAVLVVDGDTVVAATGSTVYALDAPS